jgi:hypothetical protein
MNLGGWLHFKLLGNDASLRVQVQNLTNAGAWTVGGSPGFSQAQQRTYLGYVTVNL